MMKRTVLAVLCLAATACDDPIQSEPGCNAGALPVTGSAAAPTVVAVTLEAQPDGIVVLATATDPQGSGNLADVMQSIGVHQNAQCTGTPLIVTDDLAGSGLEESFGTVVTPAQNQALYSAIAAAASWPVDVDFRDADGNRTAGRVLARVTS